MILNIKGNNIKICDFELFDDLGFPFFGRFGIYLGKDKR